MKTKRIIITSTMSKLGTDYDENFDCLIPQTGGNKWPDFQESLNKEELVIAWEGGYDDNGEEADNRSSAQHNALLTLVRYFIDMNQDIEVGSFGDLNDNYDLVESKPMFDVCKWLFWMGIHPRNLIDKYGMKFVPNMPQTMMR